ncbi:hypothetical protein NHX12_008330 [Muraenolepis orangiensis]|uniref:Uncharacterized protein n=1 Tax=Muraenolepis orangiensis TaxID=630683 RepID=A0A9Q0I978_9TELE|nr:hypothetical protein NHX12_008330 [Muraenolepis orangiensis]
MLLGPSAMGEWTILERLLEAAVQQHSTMIGSPTCVTGAGGYREHTRPPERPLPSALMHALMPSYRPGLHPHRVEPSPLDRAVILGAGGVV